MVPAFTDLREGVGWIHLASFPPMRTTYMIKDFRRGKGILAVELILHPSMLSFKPPNFAHI
jgi:hypothetical protein